MNITRIPSSVLVFTTGLATAMSHYPETSSFMRCTFLGNAGRLYGGALLTEPRASLALDHCVFADNFPSNGGAVYVAASNAIELELR